MSFEKVILETAADGESILVFPSEVSASLWRRRVLDAGAAGTVEADRFISWDRFKERITGTEHTALPANRALRLVFSSSFLKKISAGVLSLDALLPRHFGWNADAFTSYLSRVLPGLNVVLEAAGEAGRENIGPAFDDMVRLEENYGAFLEANGFFEPSRRSIRVKTNGSRYLICFPGIIEDYEEYAPFISGPGFRTLDPDQENGTREVRRFPTTLEEMDWVLSRVAAYLDSGMKPGDILVTVPEGDEWRYLEREARLYGIPLDMRIGRSLTDYRGGAFFTLLSEIIPGNLELPALEGLFLNRAFPWKERESGLDLVRFGREHAILKNYGKVNLWKTKLLSEGKGDLWRFLEAVTEGIRRLSSAPSFAELRVRVYAFIDRFLDVESWSDEDRKVFRYALDSIGDFVKVEQQLVEEPETRPFPLWLSYLTGSVYVPKGAGGGVRVFPYGVTAGIVIPVHFVVGADQTHIRKVGSIPSFLREDQRRTCGITDRDITDAYLSLYMVSGHDVHISYSTQGFDGPGLVPPLLMDRTAPGGDGDHRYGPHYREEDYWAGNGTAPSALPGCLKEGFGNIAGTAFRSVPAAFEFSGRRDPAEALAERRKDENGCIVVTPTGLDTYIRCRFEYLLLYLLDVEEGVPRPLFPDPLLKGIFLHDVLKRCMEYVREERKGFVSGNGEAYMKVFRSIIGETAKDWEKRGRSFIGPVWQAHLEWTRRRCEAFLEAEEETLSGYTPLWLEKEISSRLDQYPVVVKGKIDRLSTLEDRVVLIDYKTRVHFKRGDFPEEGPLTSYQLPLYAWLTEREGHAVDRALYYGITEGKYFNVFAAGEKTWMSAERFRECTDTVPRLAREMAEGLLGGNYTFPETPCEGCRFRMVCREKYGVRVDDSAGRGGCA